MKTLKNIFRSFTLLELLKGMSLTGKRFASKKIYCSIP